MAIVTPAFLAFLLSAAPQDDRIKKTLELLKSDDLADREEGFEELKKIPLEKLPLLEPDWDSREPEVKSRLREAATHVLCRSLGRRVERFSARAVATRDVMERWAHDPAMVPKGYERISNGGAIKGENEYEYLKSEEILVESEPAITHEDIELAEPTKQLSGGGGGVWVVSFQLTLEGAKKFDVTAARLYAQKPSGLLALIVDGRIVMAPVIRSPSFGGRGQISGGSSEEDCKRTAELLKGGTAEIAWKAEPISPAAADREELMKLVRGTPGFEKATVAKSGDNGFTVRNSLEAGRSEVAGLWRLLRRKGYVVHPWEK